MDHNTTTKQIVDSMVEVTYCPDLYGSELDDRQWKEIPFAALAGLGSAFSNIPKACRTVTQTIDTGAAGAEGLYYVKFPEGITGQLAKKKGEEAFLGTILNNGIEGQARLTKVPLTATTVMPYNPTMMLMAMALIHIDKQLSDIKKKQAEILEFLEVKEVKQLEADLRTLTEIQSDYKYNWNDEKFVRVNLNQVQNIGSNAKGKIALYRQQAVDHLPKKFFLHTNYNLSRQARELEKRFESYRLALYVYAFSRYLSVMLLGNFSPEYLAHVREEVKKYVDEYQQLYTRCYNRLSNIAGTAVEKKLSDKMAKGNKDIGQVIANNEVLSKGLVDEALLGIGNQIDKMSSRDINKVLNHFQTYERTNVEPFIACIDEMDQLNNQPFTMIVEGDKLYIEEK